MSKVIGYMRVSTDIQAEKGLGLTIQRKAIQAWAKAEGHKVVAWHSDEGISGSNGLDTRPGLAAAFQDLEDDKAEIIAVYRLDRLARNLANQETWIERLERNGKQVVSVTEPNVGDDEMRALVRQILGAVAQYERAVIVRRMQGGRAAKAANGGYAYGSPAFGQRAEGKELVADETEQTAIARIGELHQAGRSLREIITVLETEGIQPKRGTRWYPATVNRVIARLGL